MPETRECNHPLTAGALFQWPIPGPVPAHAPSVWPVSPSFFSSSTFRSLANRVDTYPPNLKTNLRLLSILALTRSYVFSLADFGMKAAHLASPLLESHHLKGKLSTALVLIKSAAVSPPRTSALLSVLARSPLFS